MSASPTTKSGNNFDLLRLLLAILVLYSHSKMMVDINRPFFDLQQLTRDQTYFGDIAVNGFFAISGYLITMSWDRSPQLVTYLRRRISRIYPGYLMAMVFTILVAGCLGTNTVASYFQSIPWVKLLVVAVTLGKIPNLATFLSNPLPGEMNSSLWSIRVEFECYLLVIALGLTRCFKRPAILLVFFAVTTILVALATFNLASRLPFLAMDRQYLSIRSLGYFLAGMGLYLYRDRVQFTKRGALVALGGLVLASALGGFEVVSLFAIPYLLFFVALRPALELPRGLRGNDLSYGIYLYGWPVQQVTGHLGPGLSPYTVFGISLIVTAALAALSWKFIESPWLARRTNR